MQKYVARTSCRSRQTVSNHYLVFVIYLQKVGVDTDENEPPQVEVNQFLYFLASLRIRRSETLDIW